MQCCLKRSPNDSKKNVRVKKNAKHRRKQSNMNLQFQKKITFPPDTNFGLKRKGTKIIEVGESSPADKAFIEGWSIYSINGKEVSSDSQVKKMLSDAKESKESVEMVFSQTRTGLQEGIGVFLEGLQSELGKEHNGKSGTIIESFNSESSRYFVRMHSDGSILAVRPSNLVIDDRIGVRRLKVIPSRRRTRGLTAKQKREFRETFALFDADGDGTISANEIGKVLRNLGQAPSDTELRDLVHEVDTDGNGDIDYDEFLEMMCTQGDLESQDQAINDEDLEEAFKIFDKNSDGLISAEEIRKGMKSLGEVYTKKQAESLLKDLDQNNDGYIDFEEFKKMLQM